MLAVGSRAVWPMQAQALFIQLPQAVQHAIRLAPDWSARDVSFDAVLHQGDAASLLATLQALAARPGAVIGVASTARDVPLERLLIERSLSVNTAAAGGNASLMAIA
ncbi:Bifunctional protein PutA [compost metagenome]